VVRRIDEAPPSGRMVVRVVVMSVGVIVVCRCACCHVQILPSSPFSDLAVLVALVPFTCQAIGLTP